jgi:hypothetical protein
MAGDGAAGGAGGTPTDDPDVLARAAVVIGSCYPDDGVSRVVDGLWHSEVSSSFWPRFRLQAECIVAAGEGCRALDECLGWTLAESSGCTPGRTCDGTVFKYCFERPGFANVEQVMDCGTIGLSCDTRTVCVEPPAVTCDPDTYVPNCEGGRPRGCPPVGVVSQGPVCADVGLACEAGELGGAATIISDCVGAGAPCSPSSAKVYDGVACVGERLDACIGGRRETIDCTVVGEGFSCQEYDGFAFCGLASACLPANHQGDRDVPQGGIPEPFCDGAVIEFCNAGRLERVDCTTLGFTGCDVEAGYGCVPSPQTEISR